ncbi:MAG: prolipoprotein diacylglyceryl transferase [Alphaproteobacteria bacterium]
MTFAIPFPTIDPVLVEIGPFALRWYALAYIAGIVLAWRYIRALAARQQGGADARAIDDFVVWATLGVVFGGRLGYVFFYKPGYYLANPQEILFVWQGGMSFHGGMLGVAAALVLFARRRGLGLLSLSDLVACAAPIGLFFGRIANFVNGELWGRASDAPWAMVFPHAGPDPRHPSQLYEAALEGAVLFVVMLVLWRMAAVRDRRGFLTGAFLTGYGAFRFIVEFFREPDAHLGFLFAGATMGQLLSLPMIAAGLWLIARATPAAKPRAP